VSPKLLPDRKAILDLIPKKSIIAEIGSFRGDYASTILERTDPSELWLIDPWEGWSQITAEDGVTTILEPNLAETFIRLHFRFDTRVVKLARGRGEELLEFFPDNYFDAIYIDAVHSTEAVKRDLDLANKKVRKGGFIFGHDWQYDTVKEGVYSFLNKTGYNLDYLTQEPLNSYGICKGQPTYRSPVSLGTIIATHGRPSLEKAIESVLREAVWEDGDEVWVISDGDRENVRKICEKYPEVKYEYTPLNGGYGGAQRTKGYKISSCRYLRHIDDDDAAIPGSGKIIKEIISEDIVIGRPRFRIFRILNPDIWQWEKLVLGNVSTQCFVVPRVPCLPGWPPEYAGDFTFAVNCAQFLPVVWHKEVVAHRNLHR